MQKLLETLWSKKTSEGYAALKELLTISQSSNALYPYMENFIKKIDSDNSYFRTRALALIVANAQWDTDYKIDENIDAILAHITDVKPITARQFIKDLPRLAKASLICANIFYPPCVARTHCAIPSVCVPLLRGTYGKPFWR